MRAFLAGAVCTVRALVLLRRHPALWRHALVPILVSLLLAAVLYVVVLGVGFQLIGGNATLVAIPFLGLLSIPLCVAAGTLFVCERLR